MKNFYVLRNKKTSNLMHYFQEYERIIKGKKVKRLHDTLLVFYSKNKILIWIKEKFGSSSNSPYEIISFNHTLKDRV